jgi:hypothetical protein
MHNKQSKSKKMKLSLKNLLKGLNISEIQIEPNQEDFNSYAFRCKNWRWEYGLDFELICDLEVYAKEDFTHETYINKIVVIDNERNVVKLSENQKNIIESKIKESIKILSLQY